LLYISKRDVEPQFVDNSRHPFRNGRNSFRAGRQMPTSISSDAIAKQRDLLIIGNGLWCRFAEGDLIAHFLDGRGEGFDSFLLLCSETPQSIRYPKA
jgi:hypothetical protein